MATDKQIAANRANAAKSTGPRTPAGKAASSRNAIRSGLYARDLIIPGEDLAAFEALAREYEADCSPVGPRERAVVDTLIHTDWLLRRIRHVETTIWNTYDARARVSDGDHYDLDVTLAHVYDHWGGRLEYVQRRLNCLDRAYHQALADLKRLQTARSTPRPEPAAPAGPDPRPPKENGFVSSPAPRPRPNPSPGARPAAPDKIKKSPQNKNHEIWRHRLSRKQLRSRRVLRRVHQPRAEGRVHLA